MYSFSTYLYVSISLSVRIGIMGLLKGRIVVLLLGQPFECSEVMHVSVVRNMCACVSEHPI